MLLFNSVLKALLTKLTPDQRDTTGLNSWHNFVFLWLNVVALPKQHICYVIAGPVYLLAINKIETIASQLKIGVR